MDLETIEILFMNGIPGCLELDYDKVELINNLQKSGMERKLAINIATVLEIGNNLGIYWENLESYDYEVIVNRISEQAMLKKDIVHVILSKFSVVFSIKDVGDLDYLTIKVDDGEGIVTSCDKGAEGIMSIPKLVYSGEMGGILKVTSIGDDAFFWCENLTSIVIPDSVTSIGDSAFEGCGNLTSIVIPDSVTSIGDSAFSWCKNLTSIVIPDSVTSIGDYAFSTCKKLTSIVIPDSVTSIGDGAFSRCENLTSIIIPDSVTSIGDGAFYGCENLTSIIIPDSVTSIGGRAFFGCSNLTSIIVSENNLHFSSNDGNIFDKDSYRILVCPPGKTGEYTIPVGITSIGDCAFSGCENLTSIVIPDSVTSIGEWAFDGCENLTSIVIPDSVTSIGEGAFTGCEKLTFIVIPDSVTSIGDHAFNGCENLTSIVIPDGVTSIREGMFYNLTSTHPYTRERVCAHACKLKPVLRF